MHTKRLMKTFLIEFCTTKKNLFNNILSTWMFKTNDNFKTYNLTTLNNCYKTKINSFLIFFRTKIYYSYDVLWSSLLFFTSNKYTYYITTKLFYNINLIFLLVTFQMYDGRFYRVLYNIFKSSISMINPSTASK